MTDVQLPNEDRDPERPWLDYRGSLELKPPRRRGYPSADRPYPVEEAMPELWRRVKELTAEQIEAAVASPASDPAITAAARAYLDGEPDALGAAAVFDTAAASTSLWEVSRQYHQFDAWILEHGADFAVHALMRQLEIRIVSEHTGKSYAPTRYRPDSPAFRFAPANPKGAQWTRTESLNLRAYLSALPGPEYRRHRALLEPYGRNHQQRLVRAYAMPTEADWVEQVCAEWAERDAKTWHDQYMLIASVSSMDQLAAAGLRRNPSQNGHSNGVASLVELFGADCAPFLLAAFEIETHEYIGDASLYTVLSGLPSDTVADHLLRNLVAGRTGPYALEFAERFPRRMLRAVARVAPGASPSLRSRFAHLVATTPMLGAAHAVAEPDVKDAVDRLLTMDGAPPEAAEPPRFLAEPPWKRKAAKRKKLVVELEPLDGDDRVHWRAGEQEAWRAGELIQRRLADGEDPAGVLASLAKSPNLHRALPPIGGAAAARLAADWLVRLRSTRVSVGDWLDRHGADAVRWLVPDAVGKAAKPRKAAEAVLRDAARRLGDPAVIAAAAPYGEEAAAAVAEILAVDPLDLDGRKAPKTPAWVEPVLGMPVLLRTGERLPRAAVEHLVGAMSLDSLAIPYAGIDVVKEHCDPESLSALSWAVFESWEINDAPSKDSWALTQLARFADAGTVERLEACIRAWPDQRLSKRALNGLEVLGAIESEEALRAVHRLTRFRGSKAVKAAALNQVDLVAAGLGLDAEQLADRLVPEQGPASVTAEQVKRLELAMVYGRTWTAAEFRDRLVAHPLLWELVRRLVWQSGPVAFRLAEDRTFADVEDDALDLPDDAEVRLSHPVLLGGALPAWVRQLADYEVLQPFDQLGRPAGAATDAELEAGRLTRFEGRKARTGPLHGLTKGRWAPVRADNWTAAIEHRVPGGGAVHVRLAPGFGGGPYFDAEAVQVLEEVRLPAGPIDPVLLAEVIADLDKVATA
ncbi:DUF4132 domain-containing protein [Glycomyces terrestris]|uniref:DUF4132 domain-containing protein n=1 Tax=Glycomyces terrestris TaxID=2493553 RepID=A0A426V127_9ACTN|nr:DUF4132 domain-containing protein [Glycomyces terrestris]RRS00546.1 DUF4132 domain-containing protein [Glycomyces terrestris]